MYFYGYRQHQPHAFVNKLKYLTPVLPERSFLVAAPHKWNNLEKVVRVSKFNMFKKAIKTVLFMQCYPGLD